MQRWGGRLWHRFLASKFQSPQVHSGTPDPFLSAQEYLLTDEDYSAIWAASEWKTYGDNIKEREKDLAT